MKKLIVIALVIAVISGIFIANAVIASAHGISHFGCTTLDDGHILPSPLGDIVDDTLCDGYTGPINL